MRAIKNLFVLVIVLGALGAGAVAALRFARAKPSAAERIKPDLVGVSAAGMYVYAARIGTHVVVFDTGADPEGRPVDAAVEALGARHADVTDIFLTHAHPDHIAGAAAFPNAKIDLGAADVPVAEKKAESTALVPKLMAKALSVPSVAVTDPLTGPSSVDLGDGKAIKAIPMPGHTPGSYAFLYDGVLFAGDALVFKQGRLERAPKLFDADTEAAKAALLALKPQLAGTELEAVCAGHGGCTPKGLGKNLFDDLMSRM